MASVYVEHYHVTHTTCVECFCFIVTLYPITGQNRIIIASCSHMLAGDQTRVRLMPYEGVDGSDYINANYIDVSCKWFYLQANDIMWHYYYTVVFTV